MRVFNQRTLCCGCMPVKLEAKQGDGALRDSLLISSTSWLVVMVKK